MKGRPYGLLDMAGNVAEWTEESTCIKHHDRGCGPTPDGDGTWFAGRHSDILRIARTGPRTWEAAE